MADRVYQTMSGRFGLPEIDAEVPASRFVGDVDSWHRTRDAR
jgi:hypothetical protein